MAVLSGGKTAQLNATALAGLSHTIGNAALVSILGQLDKGPELAAYTPPEGQAETAPLDWTGSAPALAENTGVFSPLPTGMPAWEV